MCFLGLQVNATEFYLDVIGPSWWGRICIECWSIREPQMKKGHGRTISSGFQILIYILLPFEFPEFPGADDGWSAELGQETDGLKDFGFDVTRLSQGAELINNPKQGSDKSQTMSNIQVLLESSGIPTWVCLKMSCTPLYPMVLLIIIPTKWL